MPRTYFNGVSKSNLLAYCDASNFGTGADQRTINPQAGNFEQCFENSSKAKRCRSLLATLAGFTIAGGQKVMETDLGPAHTIRALPS
jgi:hypothetical protein